MLTPNDVQTAQTVVDGGLAVIILTVVFAFLAKMVNKLSAVIDEFGTKVSKALSDLGTAMQKQTDAFSNNAQSMAVHSEVIRGLSNDINELKMAQYQRPLNIVTKGGGPL